MKDLALVMYSHSSYADVWPIYFEQAEKFMLPEIKKYIFVDIKANIDLIPKDWHIVVYEDSLQYHQKAAKCLLAVKEDYVLFTHEDMFLYAEPNYTALNEVLYNLQSDKLDYVVLSRTSVPRSVDYINDHLHDYTMDDNWIFAIQPAIWKRLCLYKVYSSTSSSTIWDFEVKAQHAARKMRGAFLYYGESLRGSAHYDSIVYPYCATALVKGHWNMREYSRELTPILERHGIDPNIRGIF